MINLFKIFLCMTLVIWVTSVNPLGTYALSYLNTNVSIPQNITLKITDRYISIRGGCNTQTGYASLNSDGSAKFGPFLSTAQQNICTNSVDSTLLDSFINSTSYKINIDKSISLFDVSTALKANLTLLQANSTAVSVVGILATLDAINNGNITIPNNSSSKTATTTTTTTNTNSTTNNTSSNTGNTKNDTKSTTIVDQSTTTTTKITSNSSNTALPNNSQSTIVVDSQNLTTTQTPNTSQNSTTNTAIRIANNIQVNTTNVTIPPLINTQTNTTSVPTPPQNSTSNTTIIPSKNTSTPVVQNTTTNKNISSENKTTTKNNTTTSTTTTTVPSVVPVLPPKTLINLDGLYESSVTANPNILIRINGSSVSLVNGCNSAQAQFSAFTDGSLTVGAFITTLKYCNNDTDSLYLTALTNSVKYLSFANNSLLILSDSKNLRTITLSVYTPPAVVESPPFSFANGKYSTNIQNDTNVLIQFEGNQVNILNACNSLSSTYTAFKNGTIKFKQFGGTEMACTSSYDYIFENALQNSVNYQINGNVSTFKNSQNQSTIILTSYIKPVVPVTPVTPVEPVTPVKPVEPVTPVKPVEPVTPVKPVEPVTPVKPVEPVTPITPIVPVTPVKPVEPVTPITPIVPVTPLKPVEPITPIVPVIPTPIAVTLDGIYVSNLQSNSNIQINITGNKLYLVNGCNSQSTSYKADQSGSFSVGFFISTRMACVNDYDYLYTNAFTNSISYSKSGNQIIFKDSSKKSTIILSPYVYVAPPKPVATAVAFTGNFSTNIQNTQNLLVSFSNAQLNLLNGCNSQSSSYFAYSNGTFKVSGFASSVKYCSNDYDYIYTQKLSSSISFVQIDNDHLSLFDSNNQSTLVLTRYTPPVVVTPPIVIVSPPVVIITQNITVYYNISQSLKMYSGYFFVSSADVNMVQIMAYLENNYYVFLHGNTILAAVRTYVNNFLYYQILMKSTFGTFNAILEYHTESPASSRILLRSLAIVQTSNLQIDYSNCLTKDLINKNCKVCQTSYTNLMGWCVKADPLCQKSIVNECMSCKSGCKLSQGVCTSM